MNQDERRAKAAIEGGMAGDALRNRFPPTVADILVRWAIYGMNNSAHQEV